MRMTPAMLILGGLLVFWASAFIVVILPVATIDPAPSDIWRPMTADEQAGHGLYVANGCSYCHSLFVRVNDWGLGASRIAQPGDYAGQRPAILGTERTGPDLSQEGGEHPDDWHLAHFVNPRNTSPVSVMPSWRFLGNKALRELTAYVQYLGMQNADRRMARQRQWKERAQAAYRKGPESNVEWLHSQVPGPWRPMPNPYPASEAALARGRKIYQDFCIGCHGPVGDGQGPAAELLSPPPLNFTILRKHLVDGQYVGGIFYYQIMNGVTGTAMPYFKRALESEKIWDVSNFLAVSFVGYTDADLEPQGIDAAYEDEWTNESRPPQTEGLSGGTPAGGTGFLGGAVD